MAGLAPTKRPIGIFKAINMVPTFTGGEPAAVKLAEGCDVISATPHQVAAYLAAMRSANPDLCVLAYNNASFSFDTRLPEQLYLHDDQGGRVHSNNYPGNWCMDPASSAWASTLIAQCEENVGDHDGVMLDMMGPYPTAPGYLSALAVNPRTGKPYTAADWCTDTAQLGGYVKNALRTMGKDVVGNGLVDGGRMLATPSTTVILQGIDGGLAEGWMPLKEQSEFADAVNALDIAPGTDGKYLFPMVKPWKAPTSADVDTAHRFSLAAYLLGATPHSFYSFAGANNEAGVQSISPYEYVAIGEPAGPCTQYPDGHWSRRFADSGGATTGWAIVNPTTVAITITSLGGGAHTFVDLDGRPLAAPFTMAPWTSEVLHAA